MKNEQEKGDVQHIDVIADDGKIYRYTFPRGASKVCVKDRLGRRVPQKDFYLDSPNGMED